MNKFRTITGFVEQLEWIRNNGWGGGRREYIPEKQINENMQEKIVKYYVSKKRGEEALEIQ